MPTLDLTALTVAPSWLEAMDIRRECGLSAMTFAERLTRLGELGDPIELFDDLELMEAFAIALWLAARRSGQDVPFAEYQAALTFDTLAEMFSGLPEAPDPAAGNRATRRAAARRPAAKTTAAKTTAAKTTARPRRAGKG